MILKPFTRFANSQDSIRRVRHTFLDAEAERVVNLISGWKPALKGGKPVNVYYEVPFNFLLPIEDKPY